MDGQKIMLIMELLDQGQFVLDDIAHLGRGAAGPASTDTLLSQFPEPALRGIPFRHQLPRILVAKLIQGKVTAVGNPHRLLQ